jgi:hypothetical protein
MIDTESQRAKALPFARWYHARGYNPLPSCPGRRMPWWEGMEGYTEVRDDGIPESFLGGPLWPNGNIQLATGVKWGLVVVDLDGEAGRSCWACWADVLGCPRTWAVRTPRGGLHLWFRPPAGVARVPSRELWKGPGEHQGVELIGCGKLAIAPPSYKRIDGVKRHYEFIPGRSPGDLDEPATLPRWVLQVNAPRERKVEPMPPAGPRITYRGKRHHDRREVLDAMSPEAKTWFAVDCGLRLASTRPNPAGWMDAHAIDRPDRHPSARFHPAKGLYNEPGKGLTLSLFDLGAALGRYSTWMDACNAAGDSVLVGAR